MIRTRISAALTALAIMAGAALVEPAYAADCYSIGQRVAAENGGTLARATPDQQNGQAVCVVVVLVPGKDGQRPRRTEIVVPMN